MAASDLEDESLVSCYCCISAKNDRLSDRLVEAIPAEKRLHPICKEVGAKFHSLGGFELIRNGSGVGKQNHQKKLERKQFRKNLRHKPHS